MWRAPSRSLVVDVSIGLGLPVFAYLLQRLRVRTVEEVDNRERSLDLEHAVACEVQELQAALVVSERARVELSDQIEERDARDAAAQLAAQAASRALAEAGHVLELLTTERARAECAEAAVVEEHSRSERLCNAKRELETRMETVHAASMAEAARVETARADVEAHMATTAVRLAEAHAETASLGTRYDEAREEMGRQTTVLQGHVDSMAAEVAEVAAAAEAALMELKETVQGHELAVEDQLETAIEAVRIGAQEQLECTRWRAEISEEAAEVAEAAGLSRPAWEVAVVCSSCWCT